ncbi:MAG: hypothetical protein OEV79_12305 [candidate division WOR-3 bacterium]|nr:hypothetical protein [candidate division WOR-3 bacterium]
MMPKVGKGMKPRRLRPTKPRPKPAKKKKIVGKGERPGSKTRPPRSET